MSENCCRIDSEERCAVLDIESLGSWYKVARMAERYPPKNIEKYE